MALIDAYAWRRCDGGDSIFVESGVTTPTDYVYYNGECYFNTFVSLQVAGVVDITDEVFFASCSDCELSTVMTSIPCSLYGQVNIYLSGNIELVLEGEMDNVSLNGQIDIPLESAVDIYLSGIMNDPLLNAELEYTVGLEACVVQAEPSATPTPTPSTSQPCPNCDQYLAVNNDTVNILTVKYVSCNDYIEYTFTVNPDDSKPICSCSEPTPGKGNVSTDYEFINQGTCGVSPTPSNTPTNTPTPSVTPTITPTPSSSQTSCVEMSLNWTFDNTDACAGTYTNTNTYYTSYPISAGNYIYTDSACSTNATSGRFLVFGVGDVLYIGAYGMLTNYTC